MGRLIRHLTVLCLLCVGATAAVAGDTRFAYYSEPGDWIGLGERGVLTLDDVNFWVDDLPGNAVYVNFNNDSKPHTQSITWFLAFAPAGSGPLTVGTYEGAWRWPFQGSDRPGLSVSANGRGCNGVIGRFQILELARNAATGKIERFAADFEQHCEGTGPALYGSVRVNSDVPVSLRVPPRIEVVTPLNFQGCVEATSPAGATVDLKAVQSEPGSFAYSWSTSSGLQGSGEDFSAEASLDEPLIVTLTQVNLADNERVTVTSQVCTSDTTPPQVEILAPTHSSAITARSFPMEVRITDVVDKAITNYSVFLGYAATVPLTGESSRVTLPNLHSRDDSSWMQIQVMALDRFGNVGYGYTDVALPHDAGKAP